MCVRALIANTIHGQAFLLPFCYQGSRFPLPKDLAEEKIEVLKKFLNAEPPEINGEVTPDIVHEHDAKTHLSECQLIPREVLKKTKVVCSVFM